MIQFYAELSKTSFRRISNELERLVMALRSSEEAVHKLIEVSDWHNIAADIARLQEIDRVIQTLEALSLYSTRMSEGVSDSVDHTIAISSIKLEALRLGLSTDEGSFEKERTDQDTSIDLF